MIKQLIFLALVAGCIARPPSRGQSCTLRPNRPHNISDVIPQIDQCGTSTSLYISPAIVGGQEAAAHSHPWMAVLRYNGYQICGGAFIGDNLILTAAHCATGSTSSFEVCLGKHDLTNSRETGVQCFRVVGRNSHRQYHSRTLQNDIAVLELASAPEVTSTVKPLCIASRAPVDGEECTVTGWGTTQSASEVSTRLRQVNVPIVNFAQCNNWYGGSIYSGMVCAGYDIGTRDSCQGDSGGPLVCSRNGQWESVGIVSWGEGCAQARRPGVYTSTYDYLAWIGAFF